MNAESRVKRKHVYQTDEQRFRYLIRYGFTVEFISEQLSQGNRWCTACQTFHPGSSFHKNQTVCKKFIYAYQRRMAHGDGIDQYEAKLQEQQGKCAICASEDPGGRWRKFVWDHDHKCCPAYKSCAKCRRGLLCNKCNIALERLESILEWEQKAVAYLKQYSPGEKKHAQTITPVWTGDALKVR
jgi:hypothetical protein